MSRPSAADFRSTMLRRQLPTYSPVNAGALIAGIRAAVHANDVRKQVRRRLQQRFSARAVLLTDSGTSALALALAAADTARDGPAALPAYSCYDLATAAEVADVDVILYDVDPSTLSPIANSLRNALTEGLSSLTLVPLFGVPVDAERIRNDAEETGGLLIEDAAQGVGATLGGTPLRSQGDLSVLSFGRGKGVTGGGGGGIDGSLPVG